MEACYTPSVAGTVLKNTLMVLYVRVFHVTMNRFTASQPLSRVLRSPTANWRRSVFIIIQSNFSSSSAE